MGILDIKATLNNDINCDIEMQIVDKKNIEKRILFYWSKMYTSSIKEGKDYNELKKGIVILITDYELEKLKKLKQYVTKWNIRETKNPQIILTDDLEIYIIETSKASLRNEGELDSWIKFINNPKEKVDMENKEINKAKEVLEQISQDKHERYLAELRQKYIMDQKAIEDAGYDKGVKAGIDQGIKQGIQEGIQQGEYRKQQEIAKRMKNENMSNNTIAKITGLTEKEIEEI